jgi:hypothetical protein
MVRTPLFNATTRGFVTAAERRRGRPLVSQPAAITVLARARPSACIPRQQRESRATVLSGSSGVSAIATSAETMARDMKVGPTSIMRCTALKAWMRSGEASFSLSSDLCPLAAA